MKFDGFTEITIYVKTHSWLFIIFLLIFYLILAKIVDLFIDRILRRIASWTKVSFDDYAIKFFHRPAVISIALCGPLHILHIIKIEEKTNFILSGILKSIIVLIWWIGIFRMINWFTQKKLPLFKKAGRLGTDVIVGLKNFLFIIAAVSGCAAFLLIWHINLTPFLASAGIAGIALALAAKETLANFFGGVSIFLDRTYKVGDYIILDSGERGEVVDVGIRSTRIRTRDDVLITIPNSIMANSKIINESAPEPRFRLRIPIGVAYESDLEKVEKVLLEIVKEVSHIVTNPEPRVRYRNFGESSINLELLCWVDDPRNKGVVTHELIKRIHHRFKKEKIVIPFPQRDIHLHNT